MTQSKKSPELSLQQQLQELATSKYLVACLKICLTKRLIEKLHSEMKELQELEKDE